MNTTTKKTTRRLCGLVAAGAAALTLTGCNTAGEGLFTGAALGATTGLILGSMNGEAGEGAAAGAVIGAVGGAILGSQNERDDRNRSYHRSNRRSDYGYGHRDPWWESDDWCD